MDIKCKSYNFAGIKHFTLFLCVSHQVRDGAMSDLQTQLREVLRENELLRREVRIHTHILMIHFFVLQYLLSCLCLSLGILLS